MKKSCFATWLLLLLSSFWLPLKAQDFEWVKKTGGAGAKSSGDCIATDKSGNVITAGTFLGTVDVDPGPGILTLTSGTLSHVFVSKLDSSGNLVWAKGFEAFRVNAIAADKYGNILLTGAFGGTIDADPSPAVYPMGSAFSANCALILKLDPGGNLIWAKTFLVGWGNCNTTSIAVDKAQNVYTAGSVQGGADFNPNDTLSYYLSSSTIPQRSHSPFPINSFFLSKLDSNGNFVSATVRNNDTYGDGRVISDSEGKILTVVSEVSYYNFMGPGLIFTKYDANGNVIWSRSINHNDNCGTSLAIFDRHNNIYATGYFTGTVDFDPGAGIASIAAAGYLATSLYVLKLDDQGNFVQVQKIDGGHGGNPQVAVDASGGMYLSGSFSGTIDPAPNIGQTVMLSAAERSGYLVKLDPYGEFEWAKQLGENSSSQVNAMVLDHFGNLYSTGSFTGTVDFDPSAGVNNLTSSGKQDAFIHKLSGPLITGINEQAPGMSVSVYPNPGNSLIYLQVAGHLDNAVCRIIDGNGKLVQEKRRINGLSFTIDISEQAAGLYFLEVSDQKTIARIKLIKN